MRANASEKPVIGVDIGGTKVSAGLVNSRGEILASSRKPMAARGSPEEGLRAVIRTIDQLMRDRRAKAARAMGISVPGWVDAARGSLLGATNIPCWRDFPLTREIAKRYGLRTRIANDANVAALAEATWGAGKGYRNVFYVTLGTGIGTGIVVRGRIYEGRTGAAAEGGHVTIDFRGPQCGCGKCGCIEAFASGTAIAKRAQQRLAKNDAKDSPILAQADGRIEAVTSEMVSKAAAQGDNLAREVLGEAAERLAIWLGNIIELLEPDVIVIGGGAGRLMISRLGKMQDTLEKWAINPRWREIPIVAAKYGPESAMVGAAALCLSRALTRGSLRKSAC
jgi:glucokinase